MVLSTLGPTKTSRMRQPSRTRPLLRRTACNEMDVQRYVCWLHIAASPREPRRCGLIDVKEPYLGVHQLGVSTPAYLGPITHTVHDTECRSLSISAFCCNGYARRSDCLHLDGKNSRETLVPWAGERLPGLVDHVIIPHAHLRVCSRRNCRGLDSDHCAATDSSMVAGDLPRYAPLCVTLRYHNMSSEVSA